MKKLKTVPLFLCFLFVLSGCRKATVISRDDQVVLLPQSPTTEAVVTHPAQPSDSPASTPSETPVETEATDPTETTESRQSHSGSESGSTKPTTTTSTGNSTKSTESTDRTPTETTGEATSPDDIHEETEPSTDSTGETAAPTEPETEPPTEPETEPPTEPVKDPYDISGHTVGSLEYGIHAAINAERTAAGLPELSLDWSLCAIASVRAYECSLYWSHTRPDGSDWSTILSAYGYGGYTCAAENLLQSSDGMDAAGAVAIWASSDSHRENMCNPAFTRLGVGVYSCDGMIYLACIFTD